MPRTSVAGFYLDNEGGFVCAPAAMYIDDDGGTGTSENGGRLSLGMSEYFYPNQHGVQDDALIQMYIWIDSGNDRTGGTYFQYDPTATVYARYEITGTTMNSTVHFQGVS